MKEGRIIRSFDPWRSPLCTCPAKYSLAPYTGCGHSCVYCYISSYVPRAFEPRVKRCVIERVREDLKVIDRSKPIELSASSDPYTPMERTLNITRGVLQELCDSGFRFIIQTKSDLVLRDADILSSARAAVVMTITTLGSMAKRIEPGAPSPTKRLEALRQLANRGITTAARVDPIIPWVNDDPLPELIRALESSGVQHVVASTFKARPDGLNRLMRAVPEAAERTSRAYRQEGMRVSNSLYLDMGVRRTILLNVREKVMDAGMTFATCREGLDELRSSSTCDGTHLIPK